ncbi:Crp/Fnr family transcriptional regulator [Flavipsychrobacter stenotrophus]|uniref:Crp/Fnr family transcriptional regulator n=1 Tax=Flavipsychrobacter stenotrophus TaxID=2077091 RepID=A0A2S7SWA0_9BACT|nr:Crp/Fnr family transcriptional regulator [Flavipsychrobacter stenotrophus]PQJ10865.1 Crp/Fnr family transcriptional regulator [Flavipsychrobacter stenotrophus]
MSTPENTLRAQIEKLVPLSDADWDLLLPHLELRMVKKNTLFAEEGKMGKEVGMILEGCMRHYYTRDGEERSTYFYFENALVGPYLSCITGQPSQISIDALADTQLIVFPYKRLAELFDANKTWERFGRKLAEWALIGVEERMVGLLTLSPEERYNQLLAGNKQKIIERIPQHLIANYLGITPVSLSRIRNRITKK